MSTNEIKQKEPSRFILRKDLSLRFFAFFLACIVASITMFVTTFLVQMPFISHLSKIVTALIFAVGTVIAILLGIITFKKSLNYLKGVIHSS